MKLLPLLFPLLLHAQQTRSFDTYTFAAPQQYSVREAKNQMEIARVDNVRRLFCQFLLNPAQATTGTPTGDLEAEWKITVLSQYQLKSQPTDAPFSTPAAPQSIIRMAQATTAGVPSMITSLIVLRFPGRYVGVVFNASNDDAIQACNRDLASILSSIRMQAQTQPPPQPPQPTAVSGTIPTGQTPGLYPGMPGWLPSGVGVPIPAPALKPSGPIGIWWQSTVTGIGESSAAVSVFLEGGLRASNPRWGGPLLWDIEGQRRQPGVTGVGTYAIENGILFQRSPNFTGRGAYTTGSDSAGPYFRMAATTYRPVTIATPQAIAGRWRNHDKDITFFPNGTYQYSNGLRGRYRMDGYLMQIIPDDSAGWIHFVGISGNFLIWGDNSMTRVP